MLNPWYIAVEPFNRSCGDKWVKYVEWARLPQLKELISFDGCLCPSVIKELEAEDWEHNVQEDFVIYFFRDIEYLLKRVEGISPINVLAVARNPLQECQQAFSDDRFVFGGYDVVDVCADISALTNCSGFPNAFRNEELNEIGLIPTFERATEIARLLRIHYPHEPHARCDVWALWSMR